MLEIGSPHPEPSATDGYGKIYVQENGDLYYRKPDGTQIDLVGTQGADVASTTNLVLGTDGNVFELTGTTKVDLITNTGWQEGSQIILIANESVIIDHGTTTSGANITILLDGSGDFSMTADDTLTLLLCSTTANGQAWRETGRAVL